MEHGPRDLCGNVFLLLYVDIINKIFSLYKIRCEKFCEIKQFPKAVQLLHGKSESEAGSQSVRSRVIPITPCTVLFGLSEHHWPINDRDVLPWGCGGQKSKDKMQAGLDSLVPVLPGVQIAGSPRGACVGSPSLIHTSGVSFSFWIPITRSVFFF